MTQAKEDVVHLVRRVVDDEVWTACGQGWYIESVPKGMRYGFDGPKCRNCARTVLAKNWATFVGELHA
jgi:hypothetical protein